MVARMEKLEFMESSYPELEEKTGVTPAEWSRWITGARSPTIATLRPIAASLGVKVWVLVQWIEERGDR